MKSSKVILAVIGIVFILSVGGLLSFLSYIGPEQAAAWQFAALYLIFFLAVFSSTAILGYAVRVLFFRLTSRILFLRNSARQGALFGCLAVIMLFLQSQGLFNFFTALLLFLIFALIELYSI